MIILHGVSRNSHAFNCLCGDQFNKCVCGLDAIVTRDKILRTHENGVSRMSALRKRDGRTQGVTTVMSAYMCTIRETVLYERLHLQEFGLTISIKKTKVMGQGIVSPPSINVDNVTLDAVDSFTYLGSINRDLYTHSKICSDMSKMN